MKLKKIQLKNIRSYENQEIEFPDGSILLSGDIGSGKTSILLGIEFALFGLQPGQRASSILRNGKNSGGVLISFEIEGKEVIIERTLKKNKTISQDYCSITMDGIKKEISVTELKNKILELLNYPKEFSKKQNILYKFTVYTPQEEMKQIMLQDNDTRTNTLRHVFGIEKYKRILENSSILASKINEERKLKEGSIETLEQDKLNLISKEKELETKHHDATDLEKELFTKTEKKKEIQEERDLLLKKTEEKNNLQKEMEKTKIIISNKEENLSDNTKIISRLKEQIKELEKLKVNESEIIQSETKLETLKKDKETINEKILELNSQINSIKLGNLNQENLEKKISGLENCPTCLQNVNSDYKNNILNKAKSEIEKNNKKILVLSEELNELKKETNKTNLDINSKEKEITELKILKVKFQGIEEKQSHLSDTEKLNSVLKKDIDFLNQSIENFNKSIKELEKFDETYEKKQKEFDEILKEEKITEIKIAELKKEIEMFSSQVDELKNKIKKSEEIKKRIEHLAKIEEWLSRDFSSLVSSIEKSVMIKLKSEFSKLFSDWFSMMVSDNFHVSLKDDFTPTIEYQNYEINYQYLSGGERTAIALAYRLSLNQVINSFLSDIKTKDIVILDEPTDGFSEQQLDKMREVLEQLNVKQLIIVSHEQKIESFVENIIRFGKEKGVSFLKS